MMLCVALNEELAALPCREAGGAALVPAMGLGRLLLVIMRTSRRR